MFPLRSQSSDIHISMLQAETLLIMAGKHLVNRRKPDLELSLPPTFPNPLGLREVYAHVCVPCLRPIMAAEINALGL